MNIDLWNPDSFAAGHPHAQYDWLRANDPVHFQAEPDGPGYWAVTRYKDVWDVDRNFRAFSSEPTVMIQDPPDANAFGPLQDDADDGPAAAHGVSPPHPAGIHPARLLRAHTAHATARAPDRRCGDRARRLRFRERRRRRDAVLCHRRADGHPARRRARALQMDRGDPHHGGRHAVGGRRARRVQDVRIWPQGDRGEAG